MAIHVNFEKSDYEKAAFKILKALLNTMTEEEASKLFATNVVLKKLEPLVGSQSELKLYLQVIKTKY